MSVTISNPMFVRRAKGYVVRFKEPSTGKTKEKVVFKCDAPNNDNLIQAMLAVEKIKISEGGFTSEQFSQQRLQEVFAIYEEKVLKDKNDRRTQAKKFIIRDFIEAKGNLKLADIKKITIMDYLDSKPWGNGTKKFYVSCFKSVFTYFLEREQLSANPAHGIKIGKAPARPLECVPTDAEWAILMTHPRELFREICSVLRYTGARPAEILELKGSEYNAETGTILKANHKTKHKGKSREILVPNMIKEILDKRKEKYGNGYLFVNKNGNHFSSNDFYYWFTDWARKHGVRKEVAPYSLRHKFAVSCLEKGIPIEQVASLLGHSDTVLVFKVYGHCAKRIQDYRANLNAALAV
jgi:integrase/recombinase XerD